LGFLLPRLAYVGRTTMGLGYRRLDAITMQLSGGQYTGGALRGPTRFAVGWPLLFGMSPGVHVGAAALAVAFAGWWSRRLRWLARRILMIAPGLLVWGALPSLVALDRSRQLLLGAGAGVTALALAAGSLRPRLFALVPLVLAAELCLNGLAGYPPGRYPNTGTKAATGMWP